jgi:hypothetical protein
MERARISKKSYTKELATRMDEELTTEELSDLRVILVRFMADKESHKKIPCLESRARRNRGTKLTACTSIKGKGNQDRSWTHLSILIKTTDLPGNNR